MNFSSSAQELPEWRAPICPLDYRDVSTAISAVEDVIPGDVDPNFAARPSQPPGPSVDEVEDMLRGARIEAARQATETSRREHEARLKEERDSIRRALEDFARERKKYFSGVEPEVIRLALAIAAKILHRESTADPLLVGALVRIALEKLQAGSIVTVRVADKEVAKWTNQLQHLAHGVEAQVIGDPHLGHGECVVQAEVGSADLSIDSRLKEVEQNFLDLLAQRPAAR